MTERRTPMLGDELRAVRERQGLGVREVAAAAGVSPEAISAIERGTRYPNLNTLERLCSVLRVTVTVTPEETIVEPEEGARAGGKGD